MTEHYIRHDNELTHIAVIRDPVYLSEPLVKSQNFDFVLHALPARSWLWPCTAVEEVDRPADDVPHYLPGKNPYLQSSRVEVHLDIPGAEGGASTLYPEWLGTAARGAAPGPSGAAARTAAGADAAAARGAGKASAPEHAPARPVPAATDEIEVWPIRENGQNGVYLLVGAGANTTVQVGTDGVLVIDTKLAGASPKLLAAIEKVASGKPIRYVLNTHADADAMGGNEPVAAAGKTRTGGVVVAQIGAGVTDTAAIIAHENVLARVSAPSGEAAALPQRAWPTDTFYGARRELSFDGEGIELRHLPGAHTDGDVIAYLHRSDVIAAGDVFSTVSYPEIDTARGGTVQGTIEALNTIIELAIPDVDHQGGTMIVPSHGRLSDEFDVAEYRDMVVIVRDRVREMLGRGLTRAQVQAARPTLDWDARYGAETGAWTTAMFVAAVYDSLKGEGP